MAGGGGVKSICTSGHLSNAWSKFQELKNVLISKDQGERVVQIKVEACWLHFPLSLQMFTWLCEEKISEQYSSYGQKEPKRPAGPCGHRAALHLSDFAFLFPLSTVVLSLIKSQRQLKNVTSFRDHSPCYVCSI